MSRKQSTAASRRPGEEQRDAGESLPLREEYGGPRRSSDGTRVSPDGAAPEETIDAPTTQVTSAPSESLPAAPAVDVQPVSSAPPPHPDREAAPEHGQAGRDRGEQRRGETPPPAGHRDGGSGQTGNPSR